MAIRIFSFSALPRPLSRPSVVLALLYFTVFLCLLRFYALKSIADRLLAGDVHVLFSVHIKANHNTFLRKHKCRLGFPKSRVPQPLNWTDNRNLKSEGWTCVAKKMCNRFGVAFEREQLKNQKGALRKIYIDMKFLLDRSGFGWDASTGMVTADEDTWDALIQASP
ncbi:uncharacterized protein VP01_79g1 [Puccinia sorghi]|uniref:Myb/SANT-like domain-containing protein n=1 Tax=Puccinia sorghi TaxID=27349 RepID=A0A0L6UAP6_9BASI|nr:uncharacterized protein VP01_79g1 [Puccinia sorghi]